MSNAIDHITVPSDYLQQCIAEGYFYECACGEMYSSIEAASFCRKCRNYCVFGYCTHVTDIRTDEVVAGKEPTREEYEAAVIRCEEERIREEEEYKQWRAAEDAREAAEAAAIEEARIERAEQVIWDIQDNLMGFVSKY